MSILKRAVKLATEAHAGQLDKGGNPYILHPLAVMEQMSTETEKIVAVLHDVVEDTAVTLEDLRQYGFSEEVVSAIEALTRTKHEPYDLYIERVQRNALAVKVKIADMIHNSDITRIKSPTEKDYQRVQKYKALIEKLK